MIRTIGVAAILALTGVAAFAPGLGLAAASEPRATSSPTPTATSTLESPAPTDTPAPEPTPSATPTADPHPPRYHGRVVAPRTQRQPPTLVVPAAVPTDPVAAPTFVAPVAPTAPTPIPTAVPTPKSIAPVQPTVPESVDDPTVQATIVRPIRELAQIGWLSGTWNAHSVERLGDGSSRDGGTTTYVFGLTMKGRWLFGADGRGRDYLYMTFDPFSRKWVLLRFQGNPSYGLWNSENGWRGNRIEFTSSYSFANGRQYRRRLTIIHKDVRTCGIYDEEQLPDGSWTPDDYVELTKRV